MRRTKTLFRPFFAAVLFIGLLAACAPSTPTADIALAQTQIFESALLTATYAIPASSATPAPTVTPSPLPPTATAVRTPPALPGIFQTGLLRSGDLPHSYVADTCTYLKNRLDPNKSEPGTVVMPIMFHSITDGEVVKDNQISVEQFKQLMHDLKDQGFETITSEQLAAFLEDNAKIPPRSVILIVDDRHYAQYFEDHFYPYVQDYGWTVTNAWISTPLSTQDLLDSMNGVIRAGWVDVQAHGVIHNTPIDSTSSEEFMRSELFGSIEFIQQHFNRTPIAYIWPTGSFTKRGAEVAREAGYRLGFTVNPRGPVMYNWVPLADEADPGRPSYTPEGPIGDPLLVLPRYWDTDARQHIDTVRQIGKEAAAYAAEHRQAEVDYYDIICTSITGEIPPLAP